MTGLYRSFLRDRAMGVIGAALATSLSISCNVDTTPRANHPDAKEHREPTNDGTGVHYTDTGAHNSPEISRSRGEQGGIVVLWPRIVPRSEDPKVVDMATKIQARLEQIANKVSTKVDRRPSPERVCPKSDGCVGTSLGAVFAMKDKGCAVAALVGPPGMQDVKIVPLAGTITLKADKSPFREPPENFMTVSEFVPCDKLLEDLEKNATLEGEVNVTKVVDAVKTSGK